MVATSLFCPECGQSSVNPLPKKTPDPVEEISQEDSPDAVELPDPAEQKRSTLSRTTDWILKSISRVGHPAAESAVEESSPPLDPGQSDQPVQPGLLSESSVRRTSSWPERLQQSSRAQTRFVLVADDLRQFTLGEVLTGIGSSDTAPEGEQMYWISLSASDNSVDPLHLRCGVDDGLLWIEDNNTVFGTVIEEPGRQALQCIPYERYFLIRGSLIRLGTLTLTLQ